MYGTGQAQLPVITWTGDFSAYEATDLLPTGGPHPTSAVVSPGRTELAFLTDDRALWEVPVSDGEPRRVGSLARASLTLLEWR